MTSSVHDEKLLAVGTPTQKRCGRCKRKIKPGNEALFEGKYYGTECIHKVLDLANSKGVSG